MERDASESGKPGFNEALAVGRQLDLTLPDSRAVRDAYEQAQAESQPWLFNHVARSWLYGAKLAHHRALKPDAEWSPCPCFCMTLASLAEALPIDASRS